MKKIILFLLCLNFSIALNAQTWEGSAGTDWNEPSNWQPNAIPTIHSNVTIPAGLSNYPVLTSNVTINSIQIQKGAFLDVNGFELTMDSKFYEIDNQLFGTINNSDANTDIVINTASSFTSSTKMNYSTINDNITFNISNSSFFGAIGPGSGNKFLGDVNFYIQGVGALWISSEDTSFFGGNLTINRTGKGIVQAFYSSVIIEGNFTYHNNNPDYSRLGIYDGSKTYTIGGTVDIAIVDTADQTTPGHFTLYGMRNETRGGTITIQSTAQVEIHNSNLQLDALSITGFHGNAGRCELINNVITGDVTIAGDGNNIGWDYPTYIWNNSIMGNADFTIDCSNPSSEKGCTFSGDVSFTIAGTGVMDIGSGGSIYGGNLSITRTGKGYTNGPGGFTTIEGNFTYNNHTSGTNNLGPGNINGRIDISISDTALHTTPGLFYLYGITNQTPGGTVNVQNVQGFYVMNDTLKLDSLHISGYSGSAGMFSDNDITGDIAIADETSQTMRTTINGNTINGNTHFHLHGSGDFIDAASDSGGNTYHGNVTIVHTGASTYYFGAEDTSNVSGNLTLNSTDNIIINSLRFNGASVSALEQLGAQPITISHLTLAKTGTGKLILNDPAIITNNLGFMGGHVITTLANTLTFVDNAAHVNASETSHVMGIVEKTGNDAFEFPLGSTATYSPVSMSAPGSTTDVFSAEYLHQNPDDDGYDTSMHAVSLDRVSGSEYWMVQRKNGTSDVTLTFTFNDVLPGAPHYITDPSSVHIARWTGTVWEDLGNGGVTGATSGTITTAAQVTSFSPFTFATTDAIANPLPLLLISFTAAQQGSHIALTWKTTHEVNFSHFEVERSNDGVQFLSMGTVSAGNAIYYLTDPAPAAGINFYRLKMVDADGSEFYSNVISLSFTKLNRIAIYPNPATHLIHIVSPTKISSIEIVTLSGKVVKNMAPKANNQYDISHLQSGIYLVRIRDEEETIVSKLLVQ